MGKKKPKHQKFKTPRRNYRLNPRDPPPSPGPVTQHVRDGQPLTETGAKLLHFPARPKPIAPSPPPKPAFRFHPDYDAGRLIIFPGDEFSDMTITCWSCGTTFAEPLEWNDRLLSGQAMTICPKRACHAILQVIPNAD